MLKVFLDTSYAIALSVSNDEHHERAIKLAEHLEAKGPGLVTTRAIILEIGNALAGLRYRKAAVQLLDAVENDPKIEIIPITEELYARAFELYWNRPDKEWGLIDCISFIVMDEHGITDALTADDHFRQAGFRVLLKEN
jgi:predicted nucleic acid-binding protein